MSPGYIGGAPSAPNASPWLNAGKAGLLGAGLGAGYHFAKRHFYNTPQENAEEDNGSMLMRRMAIPAVGMAGLNAGLRDVFPTYYNQAAVGLTPTLTR